ncbi:D-alanyl-D-alanine carboxypeptidase [Bacillus aquiflavi]|uniref:D-alanyl-D-alanine carboxypeptidase n=1 Tax=Bacillus aquiflavi TaxID=2672567 RepID=A0A6B3VWE7_9BACI|nr:D-alanyl-D-alanine carboxypeptidase family protein [Bacillus aquiflavi]MBA4537311.1 D-alanyl-D-alanine carboxypeptidase [Bacillus aquiflavi]NEY81568.1 D-alanyl-D-alanine carboxypeptidase [Bacillus aquiflavi]UAC47125.1 D-alanyl-D-alanine carboxypeptidase [Bacillus aquiflavi]
MKVVFKLMITFSLIVSMFAIMNSKQVDAAESVSAHGAILIEQQTGRVLYEKNAHEPQRIASITKIMTAILAIESGKLEEMVKISEKAVKVEGSSIYLTQGEKVKLEDLVYGLMLRSGNDAANAIAEHVGGSVEGFVFLMNEKAKELGMKNTIFSNPHGLDDHEDHYSTPYDMALLTRYAMMNETYQKISGTKSYKGWKNKNRLLTELYDHCTGGKTGFTKRAKRTLVTTATKGDLHLIAVTLNAPDDWNDHIYLFEQGFKNYDMVEVVRASKAKIIKDSFYKNKVFLKTSFKYPVTKKEEDLFKINYKVLKPNKDWTKDEDVPNVIGVAVVYFKEKPIKEIPLFFKHEQKEEKKSFFDFFKSLFSSVIGVTHDG